MKSWRSALTAVTAAVVGVGVLNLAVWFGLQVFFPHEPHELAASEPVRPCGLFRGVVAMPTCQNRESSP